MVAVGRTRGGRLQEYLTAGLWLERCLVLWIGIVVAWVMEGVGGDRGIRLYSLMAGWPLSGVHKLSASN